MRKKEDFFSFERDIKSLLEDCPNGTFKKVNGFDVFYNQDCKMVTVRLSKKKWSGWFAPAKIPVKRVNGHIVLCRKGEYVKIQSSETKWYAWSKIDEEVFLTLDHKEVKMSDVLFENDFLRWGLAIGISFTVVLTVAYWMGVSNINSF